MLIKIILSDDRYFNSDRSGYNNQLLKMFGKLLLYFALLLWFVVPSQAQLTIMLPQVEAQKDDIITVDFDVADFKDIVSAQFTILWDAEVIEYQSIDRLNLPFFTVGENFGLSNTSEGLIRFNWLDKTPNFSGASIDDGQQIFTVNFKVIGEKGSSTPINVIDSLPTIIEFIDTSGTEVGYTIESGTVIVSDPSSADYLEAGSVRLYQNAPNPFRQQTAIRFHLNSTEKLDIFVYDIYGKKLFEKTGDYSQGIHFIDFDANLFPSDGTYIFELQTVNFSLTKKMVLLR